MALHPEAMYLTHYGRVEDLPRLAADLHEQIDAMVALARAADGRPDRYETLRASLSDLYFARAQAHGWSKSQAALEALVLEMDITLNAQGLETWLDGTRRRHA